MEGQASTYRYIPLDVSRRQIRLLHLLPSTKDTRNSHRIGGDPAQPAIDLKDDNPIQTGTNYTDDIRCTFSLASLDDHPDYEALSYVWGEKSNPATVYLHGCPFLVTKNLYDALLHMRQTTERVLWVDALCINQGDMDERASQVLRMGSIFAQAYTVVVYLGAWDHADTAFRYIKGLGTDPQRHYYDTTSMLSMMRTYGTDLELGNAKDYVKAFFSLPWWSRIWTVQEYTLAKRVVFQSGSHLLIGTFLDGMLRSFRGHPSCCIRGGESSASWLKIDQELAACLIRGELLNDVCSSLTRQLVDPVYLITCFRHRQCSNPLDKIYGFLGLTTESFRSKMQPDYNSMPGTVYAKATTTWISASRTLDVFSHVYGERDQTFHVPSYVLDLTSRIETRYEDVHLKRCRDTLSHFRASQASTPDISLSPMLEATTQAVMIDTIKQGVHEDIVDSWTSQNGKKSGTTGTHLSLSRYESPSQACWQTMCGGFIQDPTATKYRLVQESDYATFQKWQAWDHNRGLPNDKDVDYFHEAYYTANIERTFAVTKTGYLGLVPEDAQRGDYVVLMPGGKVPYILRRSPNSKRRHFWRKDKGVKRFEFIGDCYIHGIMHGEAWDESKLQTITLV